MSLFHDSDICRSILESLPAGLCVVDMQKKIVIWSDGAERITGHLRHDVVGHSCVSEPLLHCDQPGGEFCKEDAPSPALSKHRIPASPSDSCTTRPATKFRSASVPSPFTTSMAPSSAPSKLLKSCSKP